MTRPWFMMALICGALNEEDWLATGALFLGILRRLASPCRRDNHQRRQRLWIGFRENIVLILLSLQIRATPGFCLSICLSVYIYIYVYIHIYIRIYTHILSVYLSIYLSYPNPNPILSYPIYIYLFIIICMCLL